MHILARRAIADAQSKHADAKNWLDAWWARAQRARWEKVEDVKADYPTVDQVGRCLVFNVCGNKYRLIVRVSYVNQWTNGTLFVKHFLTHAEYDKDHWKKDC